MSTDTGLRRTPLYHAHLEARAKMVPFGGWEMPLQYEGIIVEYEQTRRHVAVFDTSHMGEFFIEGGAEETGLDRVVTQPLKDMSAGTCRYGMMLNERGGVVDDLVVYRLGERRWMVVVNGGTLDKDAAHFRHYLASPGAFEDRSFLTGKLDIQGPSSRDILKPLVENIAKLDYYTFDFFDVLGENVLVSRTGYTGELGYEIYYPWQRTEVLWKEICQQAKPAGLGVRDVLRIEMGYSLYGHELSEEISPLCAGLSRFIDWNKDFIGKDALLREKENGIRQRCVCFVSEGRRSPRSHHKIYDAGGRSIGQVTSGTFSPGLTRGVGLGFVDRDKGAAGEKISFGDETKTVEAVITKKPVYQKGSLKN